MQHFFSLNLSEDQKKVFDKNGTLFSRIQVDTYAQMHTRVKLLGGDADVDHTQAIGRDTVKLWGWIYLPILLRVSAPLVVRLNE